MISFCSPAVGSLVRKKVYFIVGLLFFDCRDGKKEGRYIYVERERLYGLCIVSICASRPFCLPPGDCSHGIPTLSERVML